MSEYDGVEVPWVDGIDARLRWGPARRGGYLSFVNPKSGREVSINVTTGPTYSTGGYHVWHIDVDGDRATVSPSVHFIGHFHSGNPAYFHLV